MAKLVCTNEKCGDVLITDTLSAKTLVCDKCYSPRNAFNPDFDPSKGVPSLSFTDSGTGKKVVK